MGRWGGAIAFAGWFLRESLRGGWDVAWRALSPKLALSPAIVCVPLHLPSGAARLFFCSAISLLAALLFGSTGVALVLVLGKGLSLGRALDIALVFALLAAVLGVAFVLRGWPDNDAKEDPKP